LLQGCRQVHLAASFPKRGDIVLPHCFVKIGGQKETGFIQKHWINAHHEITAMVVTPQMPPNRIVSYGKKTLVGTFGTFDSGFFADSLDPFITAHWRIAGPARLAAFETARVNIFAPTKQRTEEGNFGLGGGTLIHATLRQVRKSDRCVHKPILHSPYLPKQLTIEPRAEGNPKEQWYYTQSPTEFKAHMEMLEEFEQRFAE